ncbi:MAG: UDP-N-acetylglucosamine 2-epimerase (non-hydrolyzing) [Candidatus Kerfeldbacteria bacterium]|nr:UDP-N-acetylglucosamine 2-epimerase (non-hydrolyzing) [Candidatus Kerfeldbacteria bacterium]
MVSAKKPKIIAIVGARPQFLKAAPLSAELRKVAAEVVIHTGQHYSPHLSEVFFKQLSIPRPRYNLDVGSGTHAEQTGQMMIGIEKILVKERPQLVLLYGDTNSTLAGALAAIKLHLPIAHVEAGMRSFDISMPEENNRIVTDRVSSLLFCASPTAVKNLRAEGITNHVYLVGDNMLDILFANLDRAQMHSRILRRLKLRPKRFLLITLHRASNTDSLGNLLAIAAALERIAEPMVFPMHPRMETALKVNGLLEQLQRIPSLQIVKPVGYLDMIKLMTDARLILTDSGGVQKEAFSLKVPCVTLRHTTEWVETVELGWNRLVGANTKKILQAVKTMRTPRRHRFVYGHGQASKRIARSIIKYLRKRT